MSLTVFLAGIIQGSLVEADIHDQNWREPIRKILDRHLPDANVYCHYSQHPNSITYELDDIKHTLADGIRKAGEADLLIAYAPSASMGTAIEMYEAARNGRMVLTITPMSANWVVRAYSDAIFENMQQFEEFFESGQFVELCRKYGAKGGSR